MGGSWFGYVFGFAVCGVLVGLVGLSTALLYGYARAQRGRAPRVRVVSMGDRGRPPDAA